MLGFICYSREVFCLFVCLTIKLFLLGKFQINNQLWENQNNQKHHMGTIILRQVTEFVFQKNNNNNKNWLSE